VNDVDAIPTIDAFVIAVPTEIIFPTFILLFYFACVFFKAIFVEIGSELGLV
jgi:hypothetical protein